MPFFRRKSEKQKPVPPSPDLGKREARTNVKRTPSNRSAPPSLYISPNGDIGLPEPELGGKRPTTLLLTGSTVESGGGQGSTSGSLNSPMRTSSRLSKTFTEILHDKDALSCFIQFMDSCRSGHLIRFWLDADSFQAATRSRLRSHSLTAVKKLPTPSTMQSVKQDEECLDPEVRGYDIKGQHSKVQEDSQSVCSSQTLTEEQGKLGSESEVRVHCDSSGDKDSSSDIRTSQAPPGDSDITEGMISQEVQSKRQASLPQNTGQNDVNTKLGAVINDGDNFNRTADVLQLESSRTDNSTSGESNHPGTALSTSSSTSDESNHPGTALNTSSSTSDELQMKVDTGDKQNSLSEVQRKLQKGISQEGLADKLKRSIERDAVQIFTKYLSQDAVSPIGITDNLRNETIHKICREDGEVDPQCFAACQEFVVDKMEKQYYPGFMIGDYHYKHQINLLTSGKVYLADVLYNEGALFYFMEYMEQEGGSSLLQFWMASDNFQQHLISSKDGYDGMEAQNDAMVLYDKYFSLQATQPLGFDDAVRFEVEGNICREGGPLPDCFALPRDIVLKAIEKKYFPSYLNSDIYYKYLSELVSTVEMSAYHHPRQRKRAGSDASSEHSSHSTGSESVASKNPYLATDTSHLRKAASKLDSEMNIDPGLLNPDLLWKRSCSKMTLGTVDTLGQFVSEFDPNPDQEKIKGRIFKKKKGKDKDQEDMALQIAQMIINDVTSVTQAIGEMKNSEGATQLKDDGSS